MPHRPHQRTDLSRWLDTEHRKLRQENPGSNPLAAVSKFRNFVYSALIQFPQFINEYLAIYSGVYYSTNSIRVEAAAWLTASKRVPDGVRMYMHVI